MSGKFFGVGVGPGDPELLTLKAKRVIEEVDCIGCPKPGEKMESKALSVVKEQLDPSIEIKELVFPMVDDQAKLERAWEETTKEIVQLLKTGKDLAFITLGDPLLYSTYNYVLENLKLRENIEVETIPGVNSVGACAARLNIPLAKGDEKLAVLPLPSSPKELEQVLEIHDNIAFLKVSRNYELLVDKLEQFGLKKNSYLVSQCSREEEFVVKDLDRYIDGEVPYFSVLICKN